jgi:hypothetical protein
MKVLLTGTPAPVEELDKVFIRAVKEGWN